MFTPNFQSCQPQYFQECTPYSWRGIAVFPSQTWRVWQQNNKETGTLHEKNDTMVDNAHVINAINYSEYTYIVTLLFGEHPVTSQTVKGPYTRHSGNASLHSHYMFQQLS